MYEYTIRGCYRYLKSIGAATRRPSALSSLLPISDYFAFLRTWSLYESWLLFVVIIVLALLPDLVRRVYRDTTSATYRALLVEKVPLFSPLSFRLSPLASASNRTQRPSSAQQSAVLERHASRLSRQPNVLFASPQAKKNRRADNGVAGLSRRGSANGAGEVQLQEVRFFASDARPALSPPRTTATANAAAAAAAARVLHDGQPLTGSPRSSQVHPQTVTPAAGVGLGVVNSGFDQSSASLDKEPEPATYANSVVFAQRPPRARAPALNGVHELPPVNGHERRANDRLATIARSTPDLAPPSEPSRSDSSSNRSQFASDTTLSARPGHQVLRTRLRPPRES